MPRDPQIFIYVGIKSSVVALDDRNGAEIWRTRLRGSDYVTVLWDGEALVAANSGEVWRLDPKTGAILWHNGLKGLSRGLATLASSRRATSVSDTESAAAKRRRDQQAATGATTAAS
jgi:outer membrane protein assembly factor BamB